MKKLVGDHDLPGGAIRRRPQDLRPIKTRPARRAVGHGHTIRQRPHPDLAVAGKGAQAIGVVGDDRPARRIDQHHRPAQGVPPKAAIVAVTDHLRLGKHPLRSGDGDCSRSGGNGRRKGRKHQDQTGRPDAGTHQEGGCLVHGALMLIVP